MGFVSLTKGGGQDTWGEAEEKTRVEAWEVSTDCKFNQSFKLIRFSLKQRGREKVQAKLADEVDKGGGEWDVIMDSLQEASHHRGNGTNDPELGMYLFLSTDYQFIDGPVQVRKKMMNYWRGLNVRRIQIQSYRGFRILRQ